ncbi:unnamed protein product [Leuciscus chuanchicus]
MSVEECSRTRATRTRSSLVSFTPAPTHHHGPWVIPQRKTRARTRARTSPPLPAFEIFTRNRFSPLRETGRDAVIIGTSIVRHVHATSGKGKVCTHCFPGARVLDVAAQVPEILNGDERIGAVVLHAGTNDIRLRQTEVLKKDYRSLIETRLLFVNNWNLFWERPRLFCADGLHPSRIGAALLSDNISKALHTI